MSLGLRDDRRRRRRRARLTMLRWLLAIAIIAGAGFYAYQTGTRLAERDAANRDEQITALTARLDAAQGQTQALEADLASARARAGEWEERYQRDVASGEARDLVTLLQTKMAEGIDAGLLRRAIERTEVHLECDPQPHVRRLPVRTPLTKGADSSVTFDGGAIAIALTGASARDAAGNPEAWFDPKQPVHIRLAQQGRAVAEADAVLPHQQVFVDGDRQYRVNVAAASRGFAQATVERCRAP
ncbi:MAG: hypothetical protein JNM48_04570 [Rhodospirillales bacterium]|nr:hypothetical protein [Rhodospirillales bacterium]